MNTAICRQYSGAFFFKIKVVFIDQYRPTHRVCVSSKFGYAHNRLVNFSNYSLCTSWPLLLLQQIFFFPKTFLRSSGTSSWPRLGHDPGFGNHYDKWLRISYEIKCKITRAAINIFYVIRNLFHLFLRIEMIKLFGFLPYL